MAILEVSERRRAFPFEAKIDLGNGAGLFSAYARVNPDRTVTVLNFEPPLGFVEKTYDASLARVQLSTELRDIRWKWLYQHVYGSDS